MSPRTKFTVLVLGLALPYGAFVSFFAFSATPGSTHPFPSWFPWVALGYMLGSMLLAAILGPKLIRGTPAPPVVRKNSIRLPSSRDVGTYLFGLRDFENPGSQLGCHKILLSLTDPVPS
jgi:hypothetical protein